MGRRTNETRRELLGTGRLAGWTILTQEMDWRTKMGVAIQAIRYGKLRRQAVRIGLHDPIEKAYPELIAWVEENEPIWAGQAERQGTD